MTTKTDTDSAVSRLRDALEAGPTEGKWRSEAGNPGVMIGTRRLASVHAAEMLNIGDSQVRAHINAAYIAACDPATIRTLLDALAAAQRERDEAREENDALTAALATSRNLIPEEVYFSLPHADNAMGDPESVPDVLRSYIDTLRARMAELEAQSVTPKPTP